jgi:nitrite reductase/ring-hydroxylating ferredoxin subunit
MVQHLHDVNTQPLSLEIQEESSLSSTMGYIAGGVLAALAVTGYAFSRSTSGKSSTALNVVPAKGIMAKEVPKKEEWVPVLKADRIAAGDLVPVEVDGLAILVAADLDGKVFAIANSCPHLGTPLENGRLGENSTIVCPLHKSAFSLKTGSVVGDWCPYPPVLGPLVLGKLAPAQDVSTFPVRSKGKNIEVLIDRNLKERFESGYWEGILDAKGKANGEYY